MISLESCGDPGPFFQGSVFFFCTEEIRHFGISFSFSSFLSYRAVTYPPCLNLLTYKLLSGFDLVTAQNACTRGSPGRKTSNSPLLNVSKSLKKKCLQRISWKLSSPSIFTLVVIQRSLTVGKGDKGAS